MSRKREASAADEVLIDMVEKYPCLYDHGHKDFKDFQIRENIWNHIASFLTKNPEECKSRWKNIRDNYLKHKRKQKQGTGSAASAKPPKWALYEYLKFLDNVKSERKTISNEAATSIEENTDREHSDEEVDTSVDVDSVVDEDLSSPPPSDYATVSKKLRQNVIADNSRPSTPESSSNAGSTSTKRKQRKNVFLEKFEERSKQRMQQLSALMAKPEEDEVDFFFKSIAMTVKQLPPHLIAKAKLGTLTLVTELQTSPELHEIRPRPTSNSQQNVLTPLTSVSRIFDAPVSTYSSGMQYIPELYEIRPRPTSNSQQNALTTLTSVSRIFDAPESTYSSGMQYTPELHEIRPRNTSNSQQNVLTPLTSASRICDAPECTYSAGMQHTLEDCNYN